jgi:hypothetical protein
MTIAYFLTGSYNDIDNDFELNIISEPTEENNAEIKTNSRWYSQTFPLKINCYGTHPEPPFYCA